MSGYLLDTCVIRSWFSKKPGVTSRIEALPDEMPFYLSVISRGEIEFAHSSPDSTPERQAEFRKWMREKLEPQMLDVTPGSALEYSRLRRECFNQFDKKNKYAECREDSLGEKCGVDENDLWLASQAIERKIYLVTLDGMDRIRQVVAAVDIPDRVIVWPDD